MALGTRCATATSGERDLDSVERHVKVWCVLITVVKTAEGSRAPWRARLAISRPDLLRGPSRIGSGARS